MALGLGLGIQFTNRVGGASFQGLLDLYPNAAAAYSLRKLRVAYSGAAVRIRRSGDNSEFDFGFDVNNNFDIAGAQAFCIAGGGTQNGFITTWFDQSGGTDNIVNTTAANQPQIVIGGIVITQGGKATIQGDGSNDILTRVGSGTSTNNTLICVYKAASLGAYNTIASIGTITGTRPLTYMLSNALGNKRIIYDEQSTNSLDGTNTTNFELCSIFSSAGSVEMNINGSLQTLTNNTKTITANKNNIQLFGDTTYGDFFNGVISEVVYYNSNLVADKAGIQANINSYYGIY
jgi:hypothetical protein